MIEEIYRKYFDKDKALRHYTQHFLVALIGFSITFLLTKYIDIKVVLLFLLFTYLVDLDGLLSLLIYRNRYKEIAEPVIAYLRESNFREAAEVAMQKHKTMNRLFLHNLLFFVLVFFVFLYSLKEQIYLLTYSTGAILSHFLFDILDDYKQVGHMRNWLWK